LELGRLEASVAHQPAEEPVPERAVAAARRPRAQLRELELPAAVDAEGDRPAVAGLSDRQDGHRPAARRLARRVLPQDDASLAGVAEDVRAGHDGQVGADDGPE